MGKILKKAAILLVIYTGLAFIYIKIYGFAYKTSYINGFSAMGVAAIFVGLLVLIADLGGFDLLGYSFYYLGAGGKKHEERKYQDYIDYMEKKKIERKPKLPACLSHFIAGAILLLISTIIWIF